MAIHNDNFHVWQGIHNNRLNLDYKDSKKDIAVKNYPNPNKFEKFKMKLLSAFSWKWVKLDDSTIINVKSLAKNLALDKRVIRECSKDNTLTDKIIERVNDRVISDFKMHQVFNETFKDYLDDILRVENFVTIKLIWDDEKKELLGKSSEVDAGYCITLNVYKNEDGDIYFLFNKDDIEYKGKRTVTTQTADRTLTTVVNSPELKDNEKYEVGAHFTAWASDINL